SLNINTTIAGPTNPVDPGVGEVWVDAEHEKTATKTKPGAVTAIEPHQWEVTKKCGLPEVNLNNPHNMWTDRDQRLIYQTQWFSDKLTVFDRLTGRILNNIAIGEARAHVITRVDHDQGAVHATD